MVACELQRKKNYWRKRRRRKRMVVRERGRKWGEVKKLTWMKVKETQFWSKQKHKCKQRQKYLQSE